MATNIVHEWLRSLDMLQYAEAFIDNGYDDLEICKQVGQPDLDAIGVEHPDHRMDILDAVSRLKEEGGTQVYFTLEPTGESSDSDRERELSGDDMLDKDEDYYTYSGGRRGKHPGRTSYPKLQLKMMVRDKLVAEGIRLNSYPFTKQDGSRGNIREIAKRYAKDLNTYQKDVFDRLEELRKRRVSQDLENSPMIRYVVSSPTSPRSLIPEEICYHGDQFTEPLISSPETIRSQHSTRVSTPKSEAYYASFGCLPAFTTCWSSSQESGFSDGEIKKKGRIGKLLKKSFKKERKSSNKSKPTRMTEAEINASEITMSDDDRITLMNLVKERALTVDQALTRLKQYEAEKKKEKEIIPMQPMGTPTSQSADEVEEGSLSRSPKHSSSFKVRMPSLRKKKNKAKEERTSTFYTNDMETPLSSQAPSSPSNEEKLIHLYEEPPDSDVPVHLYEEPPDPELSANQNADSPVLDSPSNQRTPTSSEIPYATIDSSFSKSETDESLGKTDSIERNQATKDEESETLLPQDQYVCIDDANEEIKNAENRVMDNSTEVTPEKEQSESFSRNSGGRRSNRFIEAIRRISSSRSSMSGTEDETRSITSETEDSLYSTAEKGDTGERKRSLEVVRTASFLDKMKEMRRKIGRKSSSKSQGDQDYDNASEPSGSSESLRSSISGASGLSHHSNPSASSGSNRNSTASQDDDVPAYTGPFCGRARVKTECIPSPYDMESLRLKKGDIIDVINMPPMGTWMGMLNNRVGTFKFIYVDMINEEEEQKKKSRRPRIRRRPSKRLPKTNSVEGLLKRINLEEYISVFMLNGYETLDLFKEVEDEDLDALKITNTEHRIKLLTAAELLQYDDDDTVVADDIMQTEETQTEPDYEKRNELLSTEVLAQLTSSPRDSGCYASSENLLTRESPRSGQSAKKDDQEEFWQDGQLINESPDQVPNQSDQSFDSVSVQVTTSREVLESPTRCGYVNVEIKKNHDYVNIEVFSQCSDENSNGEGSKVNVTVGKNETNSRPEICIKNGHHVETVSQKDEEVIPSTAGSVSESRQNGLQSPNNCTNGEPTSRGEEVVPSPSFHELVNLYEKSASELSPRTGRKAATMGGRGSPKAMPKHPKTFPRNNNVGENTNTDDNHNGMLQQTKSEDAMHQSPVLSRTTNITENGDCDSSKKAVKVKPPPVAAKPKPKHKQSPSVSSKMDHSSSTSSSRTNQCIVLDSPPISHRLPRPQAMPLPTLVDRKLDDDQIDLTSEPYSDQMGFCGIPSALIQRYAEELKSPLQDVANTMETVRMTHLKNHGRLGISSVSLTEISNSNSIVTAKDTTLKSWLTSQGLPMYTEPLLGKGWSTVVSLCDMLEDDMRECGMNDPRHIRRLLAAIETLKLQQISQ